MPSENPSENLKKIKELAYKWALTPYDSCESCIDMGYSMTYRQCGGEILGILGEPIPEHCADSSYCIKLGLHERKDCVLPDYSGDGEIVVD